MYGHVQKKALAEPDATHFILTEHKYQPPPIDKTAGDELPDEAGITPVLKSKTAQSFPPKTAALDPI
ncbi:hypothetical protein ACFSDG_08960 [Pseudarcicella hirudinis]|uniref:hypothetical protein n=1 Tax=Pseudarcicella hirudinis TaxID=1079859 RepID=UPI001C434D81|nr:hypothetical protein [Pseudarcicella hirudinis]